MQANVQSEHFHIYRRAKERALAQWLALGLALAMLGGAIGINLYLDYGHTVIREKDRLSIQARIIAQNMEVQLATANRALEGVLGDLSIWQDTYGEQTRMTYLKAVANAMPGVRAIGIIDADGTLLASSQPDNVGSNFSHRDYFQTTRQHPNSQTLYVSAPYQSMENFHAINLTRAVLQPDGEFKGVIYATLNTQYFQTLMASVLYAPDMWDAVAHANGRVLLSVPERDEKSADIDLAQPGSFFTRHRDSGKTTTVLTGKGLVDYNNQIVAQHTVQPAELNMDKPLFIAVGRDLDSIFHPWERTALLQSGLYTLIFLVTLIGLYLYQRRQREFDRKEACADSALRASEENYRLIVENTKDVVVKLDANGLYTYINPAFYKLYGLDLEALRGKYYWDRSVTKDRFSTYEFFEKLFHAPYTATADLRADTVEGVRHLHWTGQALPDGGGNVTRIICIGRDVTQQIQRMTRLEEQAQQDHLTGLANRRHFMDMGSTELTRAQRYNRPLSLLALDIDYFKSINDTHGHQAGDIVLQKFSAILLDAVRDVDLVGRIGGEEFAILLPETDFQAALNAAHRLLAAISKSKVVLKDGTTVSFTASIGMAILADNDTTLDVLLQQADMALYQAKRSGRNKVCVADTP